MPTKVNIGVSSFKYKLITVLLLWIALFCIVTRVIAGCEWFHYRLHCLSLLFAKSTIEPWGGVPRLFFFIKNCGWGHCLLCQKLLGLAANSGPKHFQKEPTTLCPVAQQDLTVLGLADPNPKHFKKELGQAAQPDPPILGLADPNPKHFKRGLGQAAQPDSPILGLAVQP